MLPVPAVTPHDEPAVVVQLHVTPFSAAGMTSATGAPVIFDGPALLTSIV